MTAGDALDSAVVLRNRLVWKAVETRMEPAEQDTDDDDDPYGRYQFNLVVGAGKGDLQLVAVYLASLVGALIHNLADANDSDPIKLLNHYLTPNQSAGK